MTSAGVAIHTALLEPKPVDTFLVAGGHGVDACRADDATLELIRRQAAVAKRVGSICTGALLLAQAGLLHGRKATTHWAYCDKLAREFPSVRVVSDAVFVIDEPVWTSAGVLAGVDMAMAMVERDLGRRMADYTARALVAPRRRVVGEPQISPQLSAEETEVRRIRQLMEWIAAHPGEDLSTTALADRVALSTRSLYRYFQHEVGQTPAAFVERVRVAAAQRLLMKTDHALERVARQSGFTSMVALRRAFVRMLGVTPKRYRQDLAPPP